MGSTEDLRQEQSELWNGQLGDTWVRAQSFIDGMLRPFETLLVKTVADLGPRNVLDVGCGNGTTTLAIKRSLLKRAICTGVDLSKPMIENARRRAQAERLDAHFVYGDAGAHPFAPHQFDAVVSRFGVMFFAEPVVAFANLRRAAVHGAQLASLVWRGPEENDFMTAAARAARPLLPDAVVRDPTAPGPFSLADPDDARAVLNAASWRDASLQPHDVHCAFPTTELDFFLGKLAPIGADLTALSPNQRDKIAAAIRAAYERYIFGPEVRFVGRSWMITAQA